MRLENSFSSLDEDLPIPNNCSALALPPPVQDFAELLAEIAARRIKTAHQRTSETLEHTV